MGDRDFKFGVVVHMVHFGNSKSTPHFASCRGFNRHTPVHILQYFSTPRALSDLPQCVKMEYNTEKEKK